MRITFVRPNLWGVRSTDALEPLVFGILSALTPPHIERKLYDDRVEPIPYDETTDLVAMTVETHTAKRSYQIADEFRKRGVKVVMGGFHPSFLPEEAKQYCDSVVIGDAEGTWPVLLRDFEGGDLKPFYRGSQAELHAFKMDRTIFKGKPYRKLSLVQYGRGCRFACDFCSIHAFYGSGQFHRPLENLISEIESLENRNLFFVDDNIFSDIARTERLLEALIPLKVRWSAQMSIDVTRHPRILKLLEKSGCMAAVIGFESLIEGNMQQMRKQWVLKQGGYEQAVRILRDQGLMIYGTFVFGYDEDTKDSFELSYEFAMRSKFMLANFNPLTPTPGTPLYARLQQEGRLLREPWWLHPDYRYGDAHFIPKKMKPEELTRGCYDLRTRFNTIPAIFARAADMKANARSLSHLGLFLGTNYISRREIHRKQGIALGGEAP